MIVCALFIIVIQVSYSSAECDCNSGIPLKPWAVGLIGTLLLALFVSTLVLAFLLWRQRQKYDKLTCLDSSSIRNETQDSKLTNINIEKCEGNDLNDDISSEDDDSDDSNESSGTIDKPTETPKINVKSPVKTSVFPQLNKEQMNNLLKGVLSKTTAKSTSLSDLDKIVSDGKENKVEIIVEEISASSPTLDEICTFPDEPKPVYKEMSIESKLLNEEMKAKLSKRNKSALGSRNKDQSEIINDEIVKEKSDKTIVDVKAVSTEKLNDVTSFSVTKIKPKLNEPNNFVLGLKHSEEKETINDLYVSSDLADCKPPVHNSKENINHFKSTNLFKNKKSDSDDKFYKSNSPLLSKGDNDNNDSAIDEIYDNPPPPRPQKPSVKNKKSLKQSVSHNVDDIYDSPPTPTRQMSSEKNNQSHKQSDSYNVDDIYDSPPPTRPQMSSEKNNQTQKQSDSYDVDDIYESPPSPRPQMSSEKNNQSHKQSDSYNVDDIYDSPPPPIRQTSSEKNNKSPRPNDILTITSKNGTQTSTNSSISPNTIKDKNIVIISDGNPSAKAEYVFPITINDSDDSEYSNARLIPSPGWL